MTLGLVCDACDALCSIHATVCQVCGAPLGVANARSSDLAEKPRGPIGERPAVRGWTQYPPPESKSAAAPNAPSVPMATAVSGTSLPLSASEPRSCPACGADVAPTHRFCGSCGKPMPAAGSPSSAVGAGRGSARTIFFGAMQAPGRAKLILIKGEGMDGVSYVLSGSEHLAGRSEGAILFPEDPLLSPRHANFFYKEGKLHVRDESSTNGVFVRIAKPQIVDSGATFLVGEQLLRVEACGRETVPTPDASGTYFYASPKRPSKLALIQLLAGGAPGVIFRARNDSLTLGREGNDVNFPDDPFLSGRHAMVQALDGGARFQVSDLGSKNGTFLRVRGELSLAHGDYVFLGQQLLRVEIN